jgi:hypothetical protein
VRKILTRLFVLVLTLTAAPLQSAGADEAWFKPVWDSTVLDSKILTVVHPIFGNSMLIGVPTSISLDKSGCAKIVYHIAPLNTLSKSEDSRGPADDFLKKYSRFEVAAWTSDGQSLGNLVREGQEGQIAPTDVTLASQSLCIANPKPGSRTSVLLLMKGGVRVTGAADIRTIDNLTIDLIAPAAASKETTITCFKGKLTKKVTTINPKCPAGYKKK